MTLYSYYLKKHNGCAQLYEYMLINTRHMPNPRDPFKILILSQGLLQHITKCVLFLSSSYPSWLQGFYIDYIRIFIWRLNHQNFAKAGDAVTVLAWNIYLYYTFSILYFQP